MSQKKRLFERVDSYRDTGIPCGNPKRVQTGDVLCMPGGSVSSALVVEDMETQGEKQLKAMAQKQLKTDVTMKEVLSQQRHFAEAGRYKPVTQEIRGMMGLKEYKDVAKGDQRVETLRQYGLNDDEIRLQLGKEGMEKGLDKSVAHKSTLGANPDIQRDQLDAIATKMKEKEAVLDAPDSFRGKKEVSRQELDIEKSMFWGTERDSNALTSLLTKKKSAVSGDPNDPINQLPQMMAEIEHKAREKLREKRRRKRRNRRKGTNNNDSTKDVDENDDDKDDEDGGVAGCLTFEEMMALKQPELSTEKECEACSTSNHNDAGDETQTNSDAICAKCGRENVALAEAEKKSDSVSKTARRVLTCPVEFLPAEFIEQNRLSVEDIKQLPKFTNYEAGELSSVLYVKNLSPRVCERDLVALFGRFQNKAITFIKYCT
ncbi:RNA-binding protein 41-like isoform X2 [Littorina saxatilis]|uniref:RNA-binding protein 41-like isoform X2 n=1 Tax=Littorina saxatilis TaxID=31220 RepID=UPI0038B626FE